MQNYLETKIVSILGDKIYFKIVKQEEEVYNYFYKNDVFLSSNGIEIKLKARPSYSPIIDWFWLRGEVKEDDDCLMLIFNLYDYYKQQLAIKEFNKFLIEKNKKVI